MPGLDFTGVVDPRDDIVVTAPRTPKIKKMPKGSPGFDIDTEGDLTTAAPKIKKMPKGSPGFDFDIEDDITVAAPKPKIKKLPKGSFKKGGSVSSASKRADGCCVKGKTKGKMC